MVWDEDRIRFGSRIRGGWRLGWSGDKNGIAIGWGFGIEVGLKMGFGLELWVGLEMVRFEVGHG